MNRDDFVGPDGTTFEFLTIRLRRGITSEARREVITTATTIGTASQQMIRTEQRPTAIENYAAVRSTTVVLVLVLGMMAAATLAHLVVSVVRRRRRDLALCMALGMGRSQVSRAVVMQAVLVAGVALAIGLPLGVAGGRLAWIGFASELGIVDSLRLPFVPIALAVPVVVVMAISVSMVPAILAARTSPALVLRSE